ncbi:MAG TPA: hypothetical protein VG917_04000 [Patescibacteria group bacterium]|nr:hypothetical protein [Patescibacteria group bacterium]
MSPEVGWLVAAREQYQTNADTPIRVETNFGRAQKSIDVLRERVLPINKTPNILLVGIGYKGGDENPLVCTYSPFVISGFLESQGVNYNMSVVDISEEAISEVKNRKSLYLTSISMQELPSTKSCWEDYLSWTHQVDRVLHEGEEGLVFGYTDITFPPEYYMRVGIHAAEIPHTFGQKVNSGNIKLIQEDIAIADIGNDEYDFVDCTNVLYHLPMSGQMLALANISSKLSKDGLILLNDLGTIDRNPLFEATGGWLKTDMLQDIGLKVVESETKEMELEEARGSITSNIVWATLGKASA